MKNKFARIWYLPQHHSNPVRILGYSSDLVGAFQEAVSEIVYLNGEESEIMVLGRNNSDVKMFDPPKNDPHEDDLDRYNRENRLFKVFQQRDGQVKIRYEKYPKLKIYFMTAHKAKGLEAENVIIVNLENRLVGFPNQISDDPLLSLLMVEADDFDFAEERRLFYVAITRTKNASYLLAPQVNKSLFVEELIKKQDIKYHFVTQERSLADNPPCPKCQTGHLVLRENSTDNSKFLGCINYPLCDNTFKQIELLNNYVVCTKCGGYMVRRSGKYGPFYGCTNYPWCRNTIDVVAEGEPDQDDVVESVARIRASGGR